MINAISLINSTIGTGPISLLRLRGERGATEDHYYFEKIGTRASQTLRDSDVPDVSRRRRAIEEDHFLDLRAASAWVGFVGALQSIVQSPAWSFCGSSRL